MHISEKQFWRALSILINNYHAVNKKIFQCMLEVVERIDHGVELISLGQAVDSKNAGNVGLVRCTASELEENLAAMIFRAEGYRLQYKLLTRQLTPNTSAVGVVDLSKKTYVCRFEDKMFDDFQIQLHDGQLKVSLLSHRQDVNQSERWAAHVLTAKMLKWCQLDEDAAPTPKSLQLVNVEQYNDLYKRLKEQNAQQVLQLWQAAQESTDPLKFIYEDLAIAAYLISLWRTHNCAPKAFADLGCGNGLLVYILHTEGYAGYGYDVRARKLWCHYPKRTQQQLIEQPIVPDNCQLPPEVDWLIGNHSDELSPWLPVLASNANHATRYFLLPCCAYELSGAKFQRRNTRISAYQDFMQYAAFISQKAGFQTMHDRLKIPSTKRLALIGINRLYDKDAHAQRVLQLKQFVHTERQRYAAPHSVGAFTVKLREKTETVRNCTQIDRALLTNLVLQIFQLLLAAKQCNDVKHSSSWCAGGLLSMREIAQSLSSVQRQHIKAECGGIKTLLRNNHEVFEFCGDDLIGIRRPITRDTLPKLKLQTIKKRPCFFNSNHPQGCPLSDKDCTFIH